MNVCSSRCSGRSSPRVAAPRTSSLKTSSARSGAIRASSSSVTSIELPVLRRVAPSTGSRAHVVPWQILSGVVAPISIQDVAYQRQPQFAPLRQCASIEVLYHTLRRVAGALHAGEQIVDDPDPGP